ncbi:MAG: DNA polymerase IV [Phycisphaerales bacterium]|nr:DNA polymerase IV [Phycisphaerales bacterium]
MPAERTILHVDMDAFFAAIEQLDHPELRGKPIVVGSDRPRGVVSTASYEARPFGCHSAQPTAVAKQLCPDLIVVPVRGERYGEVSRQLFDTLDDFSPLVEPVSVDEAFLDLTGTQRLLGPPGQVALAIKQRIAAELHLTASVGIAPNKFIAKIASDLEKPDGLTIVQPDGIDSLLRDLPINKLWGVGPVTARRMDRLSVRTVGDLRAMSRDRLTELFGQDGEHFYRLSRGIDDRPVTPDGEAKSISHEQTFETNIVDADEVRGFLLGQVELVARRLRKHRLSAGNVTVKIRYGDFQTITRSMMLTPPTDATADLWEAVRTLYDHWAEASFQPVRLIGAAAGKLGAGEAELGLFADEQHEKQRKLDEATDRIADRFGKRAIRRGGAKR